MLRSASQTVGPFFLEALIHPGDETLAKLGTAGEPIVIEGQVLDAEGASVSDAIVEVFQADATGRHVADGSAARSGMQFTGFGRASTQVGGKFRFTTIYPGAVPGPDGEMQAPHIELMVFARGLLKPLLTRLYFAGNAGNSRDPVLAQVPAGRRHTLEARREVGEGPAVWRFDVRLQGRDETVFFDF